MHEVGYYFRSLKNAVFIRTASAVCVQKIKCNKIKLS